MDDHYRNSISSNNDVCLIIAYDKQIKPHYTGQFREAIDSSFPKISRHYSVINSRLVRKEFSIT